MTPAPTADRRLGPYAVLVVTGFLATLVTGQAGFVALAAPFAVLVVQALSDRRPIEVVAGSIVAPGRVVEGDTWTLRVELGWVGPAVHDIVHRGLTGSTVAGAQAWSVEADGAHVVEIEAVADRWGRHPLGQLEIRSRRPGGMLRWDRTVVLPGTLRVLPGSARLDELLRPTRPRVASGSHPAQATASGTDFADLRPYVPGDRLRDLSWSASARSDQPWVVVHHPERTGTVVLLLDAFVDTGAPAGAVDRAARVVWSIARHHLASGDRVGLVAMGPQATWLAPTAGRRARWQVLDALLSAGSGTGSSAAPVDRRASTRRDTGIPADAVVVGVSPMQSDAFVAAVIHHRRLGRPTAVVAVETADLLAPIADHVEVAARRLWALDTEIRRDDLTRAGVVSVPVTDDVGPAVAMLAARRPRTVRVPA